MKEWYYNESKQVGIDFESEEEVKIYDEKYASSRNYENETAYITNSVSLKQEDVVLEIGTGTAETAIRLADRCRKVYAADISETMLSYARKKAVQRGAENIEFIHSGFLNLNLEPSSLDVVISQIALHHLPDFWKSVALHNISRLLKQNGRFFLTDSVMSFDICRYDETVSGEIEKFRKAAGEKIAGEFIVNIRDEYPTYTWIMEGMLKKTGFRIDRIDTHNALISTFICTKIQASE